MDAFQKYAFTEEQMKLIAIKVRLLNEAHTQVAVHAHAVGLEDTF